MRRLTFYTITLLCMPFMANAQMPAVDSACTTGTNAGSYNLGDIGSGEIALLVCDTDDGTRRKWISRTSGGDLTLTGNVGIGTTSPGAALDVQGKFKASGGAVQWGGTTAEHGILSWDTGKALIGSKVGQSLSFSTNSNSATAERMLINTSGNIGMGTSSPNDKLDVVGNIDATGCVQTDDTGSIGGTCISDKRLKTNIKTIADNALDIIAALNPVRFDWNDKAKDTYGEAGENIGFIAQELETVLPHLVVEDETTGYKKVKYTQELNMLLIKAIQEQQAVIEAQEKRLQMLENSMTDAQN